MDRNKSESPKFKLVWNESYGFPQVWKESTSLSRIGIPVRGLNIKGEMMLAKEVMPDMHPWAVPWCEFWLVKLEKQHGKWYTK